MLYALLPSAEFLVGVVVTSFATVRGILTSLLRFARRSAQALGAFNQYFSDSLSEKTKFRMQVAVQTGRFVWRAPIGYTNPKTGAGSIVKVDPERARLVPKDSS